MLLLELYGSDQAFALSACGGPLREDEPKPEPNAVERREGELREEGSALPPKKDEIWEKNEGFAGVSSCDRLEDLSTSEPIYSDQSTTTDVPVPCMARHGTRRRRGLPKDRKSVV